MSDDEDPVGNDGGFDNSGGIFEAFLYSVRLVGGQANQGGFAEYNGHDVFVISNPTSQKPGSAIVKFDVAGNIVDRYVPYAQFPFPAATKKQERLMRVIGCSSVDENGTPLIIRQRVYRKNFNERLDEFIKFKEEHGTAMVPYTEPGGLAEWCKKVRQRIRNKREGRPNRKGEDISDEKIKQLEDAGFSFGLRQKLKRKTPEEVEKLENPPKKRKYKTFDETLQEFVEWKQQHGTAMVPQSLKGLGTWVHTQRREYSRRMRGQKSCLSDERLHKLIAVGFVFDGNEARKQMALPRDGGEESVDGNSSEEDDTRRGQLRETAMTAHRGVTLGQSETNPLGGWF